MSTATTKDTRKLAHGQTETELEKLRLDQMDGNRKTFKNKKGFELPANEKHLVHVSQKVPRFDPQTGEDQATAVTQVYYPQEFDRMVKEQAFAGMKVEILHQPGNTDFVDIDENAHIKPQVMSGAAAGMPLEPEAQKEWLSKKKLADLQAIREELMKDGDSEKLTKKADVINDIVVAMELATDEDRAKTIANLQALADEVNAE